MKPVDAPVAPQTLRFYKRGAWLQFDNVPPSRTLLELLRDDLGLTGTKEGCGEGDCGACTVVVASPSASGLRYRAINSCIRPAHALHGQALWTVEDLSPSNGPAHPVQQALLDGHASQCGFCTPGFAMSLFGLYHQQVIRGTPVTRARAQQALSGNLCRCTGYRPLLDAAQTLDRYPATPVDEAAIRAQLSAAAADTVFDPQAAYLLPQTPEQALQVRALHPQAQVLAGATDVGLWITKGQQRYERVLDLSQVQAWQTVTQDASHLNLGAAVPLTEAWEAWVGEYPELARLAQRFAGLPVRNAGTLVGNIANGSPIGDSMPALIALGATLVLQRWATDGAGGTVASRELPLDRFYTGYRQNRLGPDELIAQVRIPLRTTDPQAPNAAQALLGAYKVSKRWEDDISAVCLVVNLSLRDGMVHNASIGVGGVAATPVRARATEALLTGRPWTETTAHAAGQALAQEFQPISDMRASASYRQALLQSLMQRLWLDSQGQVATSLEDWPT